MGVSRRQVLGGVAAFSLAPLAGCGPRAAELDVAVIGGGAAGTYGLLMSNCDAGMVEYWKQLAPKSDAEGFAWLRGDT